MQTVAKRSREIFQSGFACAESVLTAIAEHKGIESELIPRIATGFCGGTARTSGPCGALSGGVIALNMLYGRDSSDDSRSKELNYDLVARFVREFERRFGSRICTDLIGCDLGTEEGRAKYEEEKLVEKCYDITEGATGILADLIQEADALA